MDRGAWQATVQGVAKSWDMTERFSLHFINGGAARGLNESLSHPTGPMTSEPALGTICKLGRHQAPSLCPQQSSGHIPS